MIAKRLTRSQSKVADESCSFQAAPKSERVETKSTCNQEGNHGGTSLHVVRDDSLGDSSSVTDLTDTLTVSVCSLDRATSASSASSPSLKSCLSSSRSSSNRRSDYSKNRHVSFDSIEIRRYPVSQMSNIRTVLASEVLIFGSLGLIPV